MQKKSKKKATRGIGVLRRKISLGARLLKKDPVENTFRAIEVLVGIAKDSKRKRRLRKAASKIYEFLKKEPKAARKTIRRLWQLNETKPLSISTVCRVFAAPLAPATLKRHLKDFANKQISFEKLMEYTERAYSRQVPHEKMVAVLSPKHCPRGKFYDRIMRIAIIHGSPKSLITNATIKRMHLLEEPKERIHEADSLKWRIHIASHEMFAKAEKGNKKAEAAKRREMRRLQGLFINKFTKKL